MGESGMPRPSAFCPAWDIPPFPRLFLRLHGRPQLIPRRECRFSHQRWEGRRIKKREEKGWRERREIARRDARMGGRNRSWEVRLHRISNAVPTPEP